MIPSAKDYLTSWYQMWVGDLNKNREQQAALRKDEETLLELVATCEKAFVALFPAPTPEPTPAPTPAPEPVNEPITPEPDLGNPEGSGVEGLAGPG